MTKFKPACVDESEYSEATELYLGWCLDCQEFTTERCEPDARKYKCEACGERKVYGAEEALMMGAIEFNDE